MVLLAALVLSVVLWQRPFEGKLYACVYIDGEFIESIPLESDIKQIDIDTQYGKNTLLILDNKAFIKESNCKDKMCIEKGYISRPNQVIVCAPHSLVITIEDEESIKDK